MHPHLQLRVRAQGPVIRLHFSGIDQTDGHGGSSSSALEMDMATTRVVIGCFVNKVLGASWKDAKLPLATR